MTKQVVTRFAPSPTGFLHIGGARTALFNWLYARGRGGKFLLRIEDTDRERSTPEATQAILDSLRWLGLDYDGDPISQFSRADRHRQVALRLLERGLAYKCFSTQEEIQAARDADKGKGFIFRSPWRDAPASSHPDAPYVIRIKAPRDGETIVRDQVQGDVVFKNSRLDDMVLLRSDGTPVYMLAVVVDDHDMGVTHAIRGDDHLNNAARQMMIYRAMDWDVPVWAHVPLIHGPDGKKLSKRTGAAGIEEFRDIGIPPSAVRNYLAKLGWKHGDHEIMTDAQMLEWFDFGGMSKAPSRLDMKQLQHVSGKHISMMDPSDLLMDIVRYRRAVDYAELSGEQFCALRDVLPLLQSTCRTLEDVIDNARFILVSGPCFDAKAMTTLKADGAMDLLRGLLDDCPEIFTCRDIGREAVQEGLEKFVADRGLKFGQIGGPLRAAICGRTKSPAVADMISILGSVARYRIERAIDLLGNESSPESSM